MKRKLIFITEALWVGGIETALIHLLRALDEARYDITLLLLREDTTLAHRLPEHCRLRVLPREHPRYRFLRLYQLTEPAENPSRLHRAVSWIVPGLKWVEHSLFLLFLRRELAGERFDTAIVYSDAAAYAVNVVQAETRLLFYHHGAMRKAYRDEAAWKICGRIIAVSQHQAAALRAFRPKYAGKITVIPNLTEPAAVREAAMAFPVEFDPETFHIVTCARLHRDKGIDLAVEACATVTGVKNLHWWIIGGGPEEGALRSRIRELGLETRMTLLGMRENPHPYIAACDLYVQPSRVEGCPMSIMEAHILGKPVLSTDNPGARELLRGGKYGLLCEATPEGIATGVASFIKDRPQFPTMDWDSENNAALAQLEKLF